MFQEIDTLNIDSSYRYEGKINKYFCFKFR